MANPWFRMYAEFADDPKVQMMPEDMQRRLAMIFCMRCKETLQKHSIAFQLRISETAAEETRLLFVENGFIDDDWNLLNWNRRQYISDTSTERVRKHREAKKQSDVFLEQEGNVSLSSENGPVQERRGNVSVTPPDTDTDTDKKKSKAAVNAFVLPIWIDPDAWRAYEEMRNKIRKPMADSTRALAVKKLEELEGQGFGSTEVLEQSVLRGWTGIFKIDGGNRGTHQGNKNRGSNRVAEQIEELAKAGVTVAPGRAEAGSGEDVPAAGRSDRRDSPGVVLEGFR